VSPPTAEPIEENTLPSSLAAGAQLQIIGSQAPGGDTVLAGRIFVLSPAGAVCGAR
jgi:hypothetical protein